MRLIQTNSSYKVAGLIKQIRFKTSFKHVYRDRRAGKTFHNFGAATEKAQSPLAFKRDQGFSKSSWS
jgi:hypothetical protein